MSFFNKLVLKLVSKVNFIIKLQLNFYYSVFKYYNKAFNL